MRNLSLHQQPRDDMRRIANDVLERYSTAKGRLAQRFVRDLGKGSGGFSERRASWTCLASAVDLSATYIVPASTDAMTAARRKGMAFMALYDVCGERTGEKTKSWKSRDF
jgi:hypothetical protein